jgi:ribonuclease VapC
VIVVDASAVIAILIHEPKRDAFLERMLAAEPAAISAATVLECSIVLRAMRRLTDGEAEDALDGFLHDARMVIKPVDLEDVRLARAAHVRFGKGSGHPAQLNFGDCFSYALARRLGATLLFKGSDFSYTDIAPAL